MAADSMKNAYCKINDWVFYPQELTCSIAAVDYDSGRAANGAMQRTMLGTVYTYLIKMPPCDTKTIKRGLKELTGASQVCEFFDPITGDMRKSTYYVGDRTAPVYNFSNDIWDAWSFNMIEMNPRKI